MKTRTVTDFLHAHSRILKVAWPFVCALIVGGLLAAITRRVEVGAIAGAVAFWFFRNSLRENGVGFFSVKRAAGQEAEAPGECAGDLAGDALEETHELITNPKYSYRAENLYHDN